MTGLKLKHVPIVTLYMYSRISPEDYGRLGEYSYIAISRSVSPMFATCRGQYCSL